jgi:hypothetical protein
MKVIKKEKQIKEVDVTINSYKLCDKCNEKIKTNNYDAFKCEFLHTTFRVLAKGKNSSTKVQPLHNAK